MKRSYEPLIGDAISRQHHEGWVTRRYRNEEREMSRRRRKRRTHSATFIFTMDRRKLQKKTTNVHDPRSWFARGRLARRTTLCTASPFTTTTHPPTPPSRILPFRFSSFPTPRLMAWLKMRFHIFISHFARSIGLDRPLARSPVLRALR